jgi:predicted alpha/beta-hydrolase family hydrolase
MKHDPRPLVIALPSGGAISGLLSAPDAPVACFVLAHGAGAGMHHSFMADLAQALGERRIATLRFQFPYMESGSKRPDRPEVAQAAVRAAVAAAARQLPGLPLFAGGKSFGGRMTSQAQAGQPLEGVRGLVFVGFPLHPARQPGTSRAAHLADVRTPLLFLQGDRDALADIGLIRETVAGLGPIASLHVVEGADHAFHVPVRSGRTDAQVMVELADVTARWMAGVQAQPG